MSSQHDDSTGPTEALITGNGAPIDLPSLDTDAAAAEATESYGVVRKGTIWVTECAWCKRTRTIAGDWYTLNPNVRAAIGAERTHGICPTCAQAAVARADETDGRKR